MSNPKPAYEVRARISELVDIWCDVLTHNERHAWNFKAGRGQSGLNEFLKAGLEN